MARKNNNGRKNRNDRRRDKYNSDRPPERDRFEDVRSPKVTPRNVVVTALTEAQEDYDCAFQNNKIVFGVGPAGTGKTWFAVMRAAKALQDGEIDKIYLTRPAVEAGEKFGFLPGTLDEKYDPYLAPVRDAFIEFFGTGHYEYLIKAKKIDPQPLAFLRGATLKDSWVIADEMQNATFGQLTMLLTRIGHGGKMIINGDPRQSDIGNSSGLIPMIDKLDGLDDIEAVYFERDDIVREGIVQNIIERIES